MEPVPGRRYHSSGQKFLGLRQFGFNVYQYAYPLPYIYIWQGQNVILDAIQSNYWWWDEITHKCEEYQLHTVVCFLCETIGSLCLPFSSCFLSPCYQGAKYKPYMIHAKCGFLPLIGSRGQNGSSTTHLQAWVITENGYGNWSLIGFLLFINMMWVDLYALR